MFASYDLEDVGRLDCSPTGRCYASEYPHATTRAWRVSRLSRTPGTRPRLPQQSPTGDWLFFAVSPAHANQLRSGSDAFGACGGSSALLSSGLLERQFGMTAQQDVRLSGAGDGQIKITEVVFDYTAGDNGQ